MCAATNRHNAPMLTLYSSTTAHGFDGCTTPTHGNNGCTTRILPSLAGPFPLTDASSTAGRPISTHQSSTQQYSCRRNACLTPGLLGRTVTQRQGGTVTAPYAPNACLTPGL